MDSLASHSAEMKAWLEGHLWQYCFSSKSHFTSWVLLLPARRMLLLNLLLLPCALLAQHSRLAIFEPKMTGVKRERRGEVWTAQFWSPAPNEQRCSVSIKDPIFKMPELPVDLYDNPYYELFSLDSWEDTLIACLQGFVCKKLTPSGWKYWRSTLKVRKFHTTAVTNEGLLLVGGTESPTTTELLPWEGGEGPYLPLNPDPKWVLPISMFIPNQTKPTKYNRLGFSLKYKRARHCSIQTSSNTIFLTGGHYSDSCCGVQRPGCRWGGHLQGSASTSW